MSVVFEEAVTSKVLASSRVIRVSLPPSYQADANRRFPVLYVHDGQNAFTTVGDSVAFGWGNWRLDATADDRCAAGRMREIIIVAVDAGAARYLEYRGPSYQYPAPGNDDAFLRYGRFLVEELKPAIDRQYRTLPRARDTALMGSSLGGLCSVALAWQYPTTFGGAASLSGAFQVERRQFILKVLRRYAGRPKPFRVYVDSGVVDQDHGDDGRKLTAAVAEELRRIGWRDGVDLMQYVDTDLVATAEQVRAAAVPKDKWVEVTSSQHNEFYWRRRAWRALEFLFPAAASPGAQLRPEGRAGSFAG
jgi:enterochelin esterase-like enzyme